MHSGFKDAYRTDRDGLPVNLHNNSKKRAPTKKARATSSSCGIRSIVLYLPSTFYSGS